MGYKVIQKFGARYSGINDLTPGMVYRDKSGNEILFVGYCYFLCDNKLGDRYGGYETMVYAKMKQLNAKIKKGLLTPDLRLLTDQKIDATGLFYMSNRPRILVEELYEAFPSDYFEDFTMQHILKDPLGGPDFVDSLHLKTTAKLRTYTEPDTIIV